MQAWYEHMPVRRAQFPRGGRAAIYRRFDYGSLLRMHVLDTRSYRSDQLCERAGAPNCRAVDDPSATMLGAGQEVWLGTLPLRDDEPEGPAAATEFLATSITSGGDGSAETEGTLAILRGSLNVRLVNAQRGYQTFDVTRREWNTELKVLDRVQAPAGELSTLARYVVEPRRPGLHG